MPNGAGGGGGGGGIVGVSNSFTGAAQALEIYGDFAAAYSGTLGSQNSELIHLKFTSGNYYLVGRLTVNGAADKAVLSNGRLTIFTLSMNGAEILLMKTETPENDMPGTLYCDIIIPAYTEVEVTAISDASSSTRKTSALITGRIYRG